MIITTLFYIKHKESKEISLENNYTVLGKIKLVSLKVILAFIITQSSTQGYRRKVSKPYCCRDSQLRTTLTTQHLKA